MISLWPIDTTRPMAVLKPASLDLPRRAASPPSARRCFAAAGEIGRRAQSHRRFAERSGGFGFPLLSDTDRSVARAWGVLGLLDLYRRCTFVLEAAGTVRYAHRAIAPGLAFRPVAEVLDVVRSSAGGE